MITILTPLSLDQGKLYAKAPESGRVLEHLLADVGIATSTAQSTGTAATRPTLRTRLARLAGWVTPIPEADAQSR